MAELKTKATAYSVDAFIDKVDNEARRDDCRALVKMMQKITGEPPVMWGPGIIGFGRYHYKYASGHEGEMCIAGFSPRKTDLTIYAYATIQGVADLLKKLGKHKSSKACIYVKKLDDIDLTVLEKIVSINVKEMRRLYPG